MLKAHSISKKFNNQYLFKGINFTLTMGEVLLISGANGSGKSTLLQIINGSMLPSDGEVGFNGKHVLAKDYSFCSPHSHLYEDLSVAEHYDLVNSLSPLAPTKAEFVDYLLLTKKDALKKSLHEFSSGMKQRVKLGFALLSSAPILILDEPSSNLDLKATQWFIERWQAVKPHKINILASNRKEEECPFPYKELKLGEFKP